MGLWKLQLLTTTLGYCPVLGPKMKACPFYLLLYYPSIQGGIGEGPQGESRNIGDGGSANRPLPAVEVNVYWSEEKASRSIVLPKARAQGQAIL